MLTFVKCQTKFVAGRNAHQRNVRQRAHLKFFSRGTLNGVFCEQFTVGTSLP
jgi:hypothetical protein